MKRGVRVLLFITLIVLIIALVFVCYQLFRVRSIIIDGDVSSEYIESICDIEIGQSVLLVDTNAAFSLIDEEPWIKTVDVSIIYPDKVRIEAYERKIAAYIEKDDFLLAIDKECVVLRAEEIKDVDMPTISGLQMDVFEVGKTIGCGDNFMLGLTERLLEELEGRELDILSIDVSFAANIVLNTKYGLRIELGDDTNLGKKLDLTQATIKKLNERGSTAGRLDVSSETSAYYREN